MTPQERQLIDDLFDRLAKLESAPRDGEAMSAIMQGLRNAPNSVYALVQTALVQDEALKAANAHIQEYEQASGTPQPVLLRTSMTTGHVGTPLNARNEQYTDIFAFLFAQLRIPYRPRTPSPRPRGASPASTAR